ncbi:MAG: DUF1127 domain-containing protein [Rhizobiaceae bacterium]
MTMLDRITITPASRLPAIVSRVATVAVNAWRVLKNRREFHRLGMLSDSELADIGLRRVDLHAASGFSLFRDPTEQLGAIATARSWGGEDAARRVC